MTTENEVLERAARDAQRYRLSPDDAHELSVFAWFKWHGANNRDMPPGVYVHYAWREWKSQAAIGGSNRSGFDVFKRLGRDGFDATLYGASAGANPASVASHRDWIEFIADQLSRKSRDLFLLLARGYRGEKYLAQRLGVHRRTYRRWLYHLRDELKQLV